MTLQTNPQRQHLVHSQGEVHGRTACSGSKPQLSSASNPCANISKLSSAPQLDSTRAAGCFLVPAQINFPVLRDVFYFKHFKTSSFSKQHSLWKRLKFEQLLWRHWIRPRLQKQNLSSAAQLSSTQCSQHKLHLQEMLCIPTFFFFNLKASGRTSFGISWPYCCSIMTENQSVNNSNKASEFLLPPW